MSSIPVKDANGDTVYVEGTGTGTILDPYTTIPEMGSEWRYRIASGQVDGMSIVDKFGENPDVDTGTVPEDIWEHGGEYIYDANNTAPIQYLSSSSASDTGDIVVVGLDINGNEVSQTATLTGQSNVTLTTALWRVYRMINDSNTDFVGTVYCHTDASPVAGIPASNTVRASVVNGNNQTLMALYTIPLGKVGFLFRGELGCSRATTSGEMQFAYYSRRYNKTFNIKKRVNCSNSGSSIYQDARSFPDAIPALTDIRLRTEAVSANNMGAFGTFDILIMDEDLLSPLFLAAIGQPSST